MDKISHLASQAMASAEKGRVYTLNKVDEIAEGRGSRSHSHSSTLSPAPGAPGSTSYTPSVSPARTSTALPPRPSSFSKPPARLPTTAAGVGGDISIFANINASEKAGFFALLDEYFQSRPQYSVGGAGGRGAQPNVIAIPNDSSASTDEHQQFPLPAGPPPGYANPSGATSPPTNPSANPAALAGKAGDKMIVTALYNYPASDPDDLGFVEGDRIVVIDKVSDDWFKGELNGKTGIFPSNYVQQQ